MPRNISASLLAKMRQDSYSMATIITITRRDGTILGFTSWDVPFVFSGLTYQPTASLQSKSLKQTASSGTDALDIQGIIDSVIISDADLMNGKYDGALVNIQQIDPTDVASGALTMLKGYSGELTMSEGSFVGEVRSKSQKMTQQFGDICSPTCRVNQLGDKDCAPGGVFANGATIATYQQSGTVNTIGVVVAPTGGALVTAINCGSAGSVGSFIADSFYSGGQTTSTAASINVNYQNSAAQAVYQTGRKGTPAAGQPSSSPFSYSITGLTANAIYNIRLHWAETYFPTSQQITAALPGTINGKGMRLFNVKFGINLMLESYDITTDAGGKNIAVNKIFAVQANNSGAIYIEFDGVLDNALICGIEILTRPSTGIINGLSFTSMPNQASGVYNYGKVMFTSGLNIGLSREVKTSILNGGNTLMGLQERFPYPIAIGDVATLEFGCDRLPTTCRGTFHNLINIQAEPYVPGNDSMIATGRPPS